MWKMQAQLLMFAEFYCIVSTAVAFTGCTPNPPQQIYTGFAPEGDIYSPGYLQGSPYPDAIRCVYSITAPLGAQIKLTFVDIDIDPHDSCGKDLLAVFDGAITRVPGHGVYCGNVTPNAIISTTNVLHILFVSNFLIGKKGFHIKYQSDFGLDLCSFGESVCRNRNCYSNANKCNGVDDCGDGTDEENCGKPAAISECGLTPITPLSGVQGRDRIVGGQEVIPGSWPWQADLQISMFQPNGHACGGTLISAQWVVSAAHCFRGAPDALQWRIHLGNHHKFKKDPYEQVRFVERIIVYPNYTGNQLPTSVDWVNDIALLKLNAPVQFTDQVRPVCLPTQGQEVSVGTKCMTTGWGLTKGTGKNDVLKQVDLSFKPATECSNNDFTSFNNKTMICVHNDNGYEGVCQGDSGGPLVCKTGNKWYLMGATSLGTTHNYQFNLCALPNGRVIYTKISDKIDWIIQIVNMYG